MESLQCKILASVEIPESRFGFDPLYNALVISNDMTQNTAILKYCWLAVEKIGKIFRRHNCLRRYVGESDNLMVFQTSF